MPIGRRSHLRWIGIGISLVSAVGVAIWIAGQPTPHLPATSSERIALAGAIVLYGVATLLRGERWFWMLRRAAARMDRADPYALTVVGYMGNNVLPARGGDVIRTYFAVQRSAIGYRAVIGTLIAERLLDAVCLLSIFALLAFLVIPEAEIPVVDSASAAWIAGGLALTGLALVFAASRYQLVARAVQFLSPMVAATRELRGAYGVAMGAFTLAIWVIEAGTYLAVGGAMGLEMDPIEALYLIALASIFVLIPSGPGYLGTLDAAVLFGVRALGASGAAAVSYLVLLRFVLFVPVTVAGLILLVARYGGFGSLRSTPRGASG